MENKQKNNLVSFSGKCRTNIVSIFQICSGILGNTIYVHETWFVVVPALFALVLGVIALVTAPAQTPFASAITDMFLLSGNSHERIKTFEDKWFGNTWAQLGYSSNSGHLVIRSKSKKDLLTDNGISEVLALHRQITNITVHDEVTNSTITYEDICLKQVNEFSNSTTEESCYLDPLLEIFLRSRNDKTLQLEIFVDDKVGAAYTEMGAIVDDRADSTRFRPEEAKKATKKIFLEKSVGLLDYHNTQFLSARAFHISYLVRDENNLTSKPSVALWLQKFEEAILNYHIDGSDIIVMTTESVGRQWQSLIGLRLLHVILLCCVAAALLGIYITCLDGVCLASFLALCAAASLAMSLASTYTIHLLSIGRLSFNFVQVAVFIAAFQPLIQVRFWDILVFKTQQQQQQDENNKQQDQKKYTELYQKAMAPSFIIYLVFIATFLATSMTSTQLDSFRHFSSTACVGFTFNFIAQTTFLPACARLFERHLRQPIRTLREIVTRSRARSLSSEAEERVLLEERPSDANSRKRSSRKTKQRQPNMQRTKKKLADIMNSYFRGIVTNYARPITILFYLTYVSFGYVGCLHFTEMIEPRMLLSPRSSAYKYLDSAENDFKPFGPRFAVIGQFRGNPWQLEVLQELYHIHLGISSSPAVCQGLKENWLGRYVWHGTHEEMSQFQEQQQQNYDRMSGYAFDFVDGALEPLGVETEEAGEEVFRLEQIPEYEDWRGIWVNFTETYEFKSNFAADIVFAEPASLLTTANVNGDALEGVPLISFRWMYEINDTVLPGEKRALLEWFDQLVEQRNPVIVPQLFIHSYELDWWRTIDAKAFDSAILTLLAFGVVTIAASLFMRTVWQTFFSTLMSVSASFGVSGFLSFNRIGLDPFTLPCVIFALPYTNALTYDLLDVFTNGKGGGRSNWSQIALRTVAAPNYYCLLMLAFSSLALLTNDFYGFQAPLISIAILALITAIHVYFFLPVILTIFPPTKKETRGLPDSKGGRMSAQPSIRAVTDSRPHLHARRYFYDSQRAISFQSEDDPDGRIEHITCL